MTQGWPLPITARLSLKATTERRLRSLRRLGYSAEVRKRSSRKPLSNASARIGNRSSQVIFRLAAASRIATSITPAIDRPSFLASFSKRFLPSRVSRKAVCSRPLDAGISRRWGKGLGGPPSGSVVSSPLAATRLGAGLFPRLYEPLRVIVCLWLRLSHLRGPDRPSGLRYCSALGFQLRSARLVFLLPPFGLYPPNSNGERYAKYNTLSSPPFRGLTS